MSLLQPHFYHDFDLKALSCLPEYQSGPQAIEREDGVHGQPGFRFTIEFGEDSSSNLTISHPQRMLMVRPGIPLRPLMMYTDRCGILQEQFKDLYRNMRIGVLPGFYTRRSDHQMHELVLGHPEEITHVLVLVVRDGPLLGDPQAFASANNFIFLGTSSSPDLAISNSQGDTERFRPEGWLIPLDSLSDKFQQYLRANQEAVEAQIYANWRHYDICSEHYKELMHRMVEVLQGMNGQIKIEDHDTYIRFPAQPYTNGQTVDLWYQENDFRLLTGMLQCIESSPMFYFIYSLYQIARRESQQDYII